MPTERMTVKRGTKKSLRTMVTKAARVGWKPVGIESQESVRGDFGIARVVYSRVLERVIDDEKA